MQIKKDKDIIGLDFCGDEFILVHLKSAGTKKEIVDLITYPIKGVSDDDVSKIVQKALKDLNIKRPYVINVIPLHLAITKNLEIPSLDAQEIKEIVDLQSGRQTPYAREEIIVDYINIGTYRQSYTKILLVIVARSAIKRQFDIMEKAGFKIEQLCFGPEGVSNVCFNQLKKELQDNPAGIIHVDTNFTDFIVALRGVPVFTRTIPIGAGHFSQEKDKFMTKFIDELRKSLEAYQSEDIERAPQSMILTGVIEQVEDIEMLLSGQLRIAVKYISSMDYFSLHPKVQAVPAMTKHLSFLNVASVLLTIKAMKINLIPDEVKLKRAFEERAYELIKMGIYLICLLILVGGIFINKLYFKGVYIERLKTRYQATNQEAQVLEKAMEKMRIVKHYLKNRGHSLKVLVALHEVLPGNIMLTDIKMDTAGNLYLKGTAKAMSDVFTFVVKLEESDYFKNVQTNYTTSRKEGSEDRADFGIACVLEDKGGE